MYVGVEVSITANDDDVNRAADMVEEPQRKLAANREVEVALQWE